MAYGEKDLDDMFRFINRVRFSNGEDVNLQVVQNLLQEECNANGIPVAFRNDTLKTGGLFSKQVEDVIVLYNPDHIKDYLHFLLRVTHQGNYAFLDVFKVGGSTNYKHDNSASGGRRILNALTGHNQKLQQEENYYTILKDCLENVIS